MANGGDKSNDFYAVLGLNKECTESELRNAYKKLALKWHPDRCSASGNLKFVEEAKKKFQSIQEAYSVLSDANKGLMYDIGVYDSDDDENGMGDFLNEMVTMMSQTEPNENGEESFEELQKLFEDMFQADIGLGGSSSFAAAGCSTLSTYMTYSESSNSNKRNSTEFNFGKAEDSSDFDAHYPNFCFGVKQHLQGIKKENVGIPEGGGSSRHRNGRKQKISRGHDVSSNDYPGISAN
uniref:J domain-containing protein n=1 Tax=Lotus japonicus TaxID=34305 RepID=I3SRD8_LOTJA|nr:unknown [Lotus japonicus]